MYSWSASEVGAVLWDSVLNPWHLHRLWLASESNRAVGQTPGWCRRELLGAVNKPTHLASGVRSLVSAAEVWEEI